MSATKPRRELASPDSRRRPGSRRPKSQRVPLFDAAAGSSPGTPADGPRQSPTRIPHPCRKPNPERHPT